MISDAVSQGMELPDGRYLIRKHGMFYRPNARGYTNNVSEAGRYTLAEAIAYSHPNGPDGPRDGITYVHETEVARLSDAGSVEVVRCMDVPRGAWDFIEQAAVGLEGPHLRVEQPHDAEVIVLWHNEEPAAFVINLRTQFNHSIQYRASIPAGQQR